MKYIIDNAHVYLKRYRVMEVIIILFFLWLAYEEWVFFRDRHSDLKEWALAGFISLNAATIGALKYALDSKNKRHEADD